MKKRLIIIGIALIGLIAVIFLFTSKNKLIATKDQRLELTGPAASLYNEAEKFEKEGDLLKAKRIYNELLKNYPEGNLVKDIRSKLDELNIKILFSPVPTENSISYEVKPGDTLYKIAKDFGTTVELLMKSNNLTDSTITPKMQLKVSNTKYSIFVDKSQNILMLKANDEVFKTYTVSTGANNSTPIGTYRIVTKLINPTWYKAGAAVPPESPENVLGSRWLGIDIPRYGIHGTTDESSIGRQITEGCVRMKNADVEELYSIVPVGTEVTIID